MTDIDRITFRPVWSDPDLLEIEAGVSFGAWGGRERVYLARDELLKFADALDRVADGQTEAALVGGQRDLSYAEFRVYEYGRARRVAVAVRLGRVGDTITDWPHGATDLAVAVPIERGSLSKCAQELRALVAAERGEASIPVMNDWP